MSQDDDAADSGTSATPDEAFPWQRRDEVDLDLHGAPTWDPSQYASDDDSFDGTGEPGRRRFRRGGPRPTPTPHPPRHMRSPGVPAARIGDQRTDDRTDTDRAEVVRRDADDAPAERRPVSITDDVAVDLIDDDELPPGPVAEPMTHPAPAPPPARTHRPSPFASQPAATPVAPPAAPAPEPPVAPVEPPAAHPAEPVTPPAASVAPPPAPVAPPVPAAAPPAAAPPAAPPAAGPPPAESPVVGASDGGHGQRRPNAVGAYLRRHRSGILRLLVVVVVAAVVATLLRLFVVQTYFIPSESMEPTLHGCQGCTDDHVLVDKLSYHFRDVHVGDIVVFDRPPNAVGIPDDVLIKRVVAVGGDKVFLRKNKSGSYALLVNGTSSPEADPNPDWLRTHCALSQINAPETGTTSWTVPTGDVFVMGDNRCDSDDSRTFGPITKSSIIGRAVLIVWPLSRIGSV